ncbi:MAG: HEAT repeat domain-containing protein [Candidatus Brocadiae bacterium]|nr:HEAT repeat domain-containing protein [Candidatus Brocadiia bacterium]
MKNSPHTRIHFLLILFLVLSGCITQTTDYLLSQRLSKADPSHKEILQGNSLERLLKSGSLSERTLFIGLSPLYLAQIGNFVEKKATITPIVQKQGTKGSFQEENLANLERMLFDEEPLIRSMALEILACQENGEKTLKKSLSDKNPYVKLVALQNLQNENETIPYSSFLLNEKEEIVKLEILHSLKKNRSKDLLPFLYRCLQNSSPFIRAKAAQVLGELGILESIEYLWELLDDPEQYVRKQTSLILSKLTGKEASYRYYELPEKRREDIMLWRLWWQEKQAKLQQDSRSNQ